MISIAQLLIGLETAAKTAVATIDFSSYTLIIPIIAITILVIVVLVQFVKVQRRIDKSDKEISLTVLGALFALCGVGSLIYGILQNDNVEAQLESLMKHGTQNPGTIWIICGTSALALGLFIIYMQQRRSK